MDVNHLSIDPKDASMVKHGQGVEDIWVASDVESEKETGTGSRREGTDGHPIDSKKGEDQIGNTAESKEILLQSPQREVDTKACFVIMQWSSCVQYSQL